MQEMWGSCANEISDCIEGKVSISKEEGKTKFFEPKHKVVSIIFDPKSKWFGDFGSILKVFAFRSGGLFTSYNAQFECLNEKRHKFVKVLDSFTEKVLGKGCQISLFDVSSKWGEGKKLALINTHLAYALREVQTTQCAEIRETFSQFLEENKKVDWSNCGVIWCGDLNIPSEDEESLFDIFQLFGGNVRDLYKEMNKEDIASLDESNHYAYISGKARIDYILAIDSLKNDGKEVSFMKLKPLSCKVVRQQYKSEFSDHYPVTATIVPSDSFEVVEN